MSELWRRSASELAQLVRDREVSAREVAESHLARIEAVNPSINAVVEVRLEEVLAGADRADVAQRAGEPLGPLHGVPFSVKTNIDVTGYATTDAVPALVDLVAPADSAVVERMHAAGAFVLARTNMPDFGLRINTESSLYGATHNPFHHGFTAGGSSGGEAAAIAAGISPIGLGNDIGGSLRNPAYCCGVASIKPSTGRVPSANPTQSVESTINSQLMAVDGVLARRVGDVRLGLRAVMGAHRGDPRTIDAPFEGPPRPRRVALVPEPPGGETNPEVAGAVRAAGRALEAAGYEVEEREPPMIFEAYLAWAELMIASLFNTSENFMPLIGEGGRAYIELTTGAFEPPTVASMEEMHQRRFTVARAWRDFLTEIPLVVGPTWTDSPFPLGFDIRDVESAMKVEEIGRFVLPANVLGLPAACVPTGLSSAGFPLGVQVIGDLFREDLCLEAAETIEGAFGAITPIDPRE